MAQGWWRAGSGGSGLSLSADVLDAIGDGGTEDHLRQVVVTIEPPPAFLGGLGHLLHAEARGGVSRFGPDHFQRTEPSRLAARLTRKLGELGFDVTQRVAACGPLSLLATPGEEATMRTVVAVILFVGSLSQVNASGCNHVITRPIRMTAGSSCWSFTGIGTTFVGTFRAGQRIAARASGQFSTETASGQIEKSWGHWNLSVSGPGGFLADSTNGGPLVTTLPASGRYSFDIGPCAVWGAPGKVEVCAR